MKFDVHTLIKKPDRTISALLCEGVFLSFLMEDAIREIHGQPVESWKIPGQTAIGSGTYRFGLENSPRFGANTMTIFDVTGYTGIRMHANAKSDHISPLSTEGCPIPGLRILTLAGGDLRLTDDEEAVEEIKKLLFDLEQKGEKSTITFHRDLT